MIVNKIIRAFSGIAWAYCLVFQTSLALGQEVSPSLYFSVNGTDESTEKGLKKVIGESYEVGGGVFLGQIGLDMFRKQVKYNKSKEDEAGVKTDDLQFKDSMYGAGVRILGHGFSLKLGRAYHQVACQQKAPNASQDDLPDGKDIGNYGGAGLFIPLPGNIDIQVDFTQYRLASNQYRINEVSLGFRVEFGSPRTGGSGGAAKSSKN